MHDFTPGPTKTPTNISAPGSFAGILRLKTATALHGARTLDCEFAPLAREEFVFAISKGYPYLILDAGAVPSMEGDTATSLLFGMHHAQQAWSDPSLIPPTELVVQWPAPGKIDNVMPTRRQSWKLLNQLRPRICLTGVNNRTCQCHVCARSPRCHESGQVSHLLDVCA